MSKEDIIKILNGSEMETRFHDMFTIRIPYYESTCPKVVASTSAPNKEYDSTAGTRRGSEQENVLDTRRFWADLLKRRPPFVILIGCLR